MTPSTSTRALLSWYLEAGVDEAIGEAALDRYAVAEAARANDAPAPSPAPAAAVATAPVSPDTALQAACSLAAAANTLDDLRRAVAEFDGCPLKKTATNLVFGDGSANARIVLIGEAPGAEEDRQGIPFVGASGKLLNRMLASIGIDRAEAYIANTVFWRPPGNRNPTTAEMAVCMPFVERLMVLIGPRVLVTLGGAAAKAMLAQSEGVGRLRGRWFSYSAPGLPRPIPATAMFHPAYLLRSPGQKREAWRDLLEIRRKLASC